MSDSATFTRALIREAVSLVGGELTVERSGMHLCSNLPPELFGDEHRSLAFADSFASLDDVPDDVEILSPGSPTFESITQLAKVCPLFAVACRKSSGLRVKPIEPHVLSSNCLVVEAAECTVRRTWVFEHYFRVRFFTFSIDEHLVRVAIDSDTGHVAVDRCSYESLIASEPWSEFDTLGLPSSDDVQRSLQVAEDSLSRWAGRERESIISGLSASRLRNTASLRKFYQHRKTERRIRQREARKKLRDLPDSEDRLVVLYDRCKKEDIEDAADMAAQLEEINLRFGVCEVRIEHVGSITAATELVAQSLILQRDHIVSKLTVSSTSGSPVLSCSNCLHITSDLTLCERGHPVCSSCTLSCDLCGESMCRDCDLSVCTICEYQLCPKCVAQCSCGEVVCASHVNTCVTHGTHCQKCSSACGTKQCDHVVCGKCVDNGRICLRCKRPKCDLCCTMHSDCRSITCSACAAKPIVECAICHASTISCWECDRPRRKCRACKKSLCKECEPSSFQCESVGCENRFCKECTVPCKCENCNCDLCQKCGKSGQCKTCRSHTKKLMESEERQSLWELSDAYEIVKKFRSVLRRCGLKQLAKTLTRSWNDSEESTIDLRIWQSAIDSLYTVSSAKHDELSAFIESQAPLHLLSTGRLEGVLLECARDRFES